MLKTKSNIKTQLDKLDTAIKKLQAKRAAIKASCTHQHTHTESAVRADNGMMFETVDTVCADCGEVIDINWVRYIG